MNRLVYRVSAFPKGNKGGNEAGVVLDTDNITKEEMQTIAKHVGYSETAFIFPSKKADLKLRYFSPTTEVSLCGHATIGAFNLLRNLDKLDKELYTIETMDALLTIRIKPNSVLLELDAPTIKKGPKKKEVLDILNLESHQVLSDDIKVVSTGIEEIFVEVDSLKTLHSLKLDKTKVKKLCSETLCTGLYVYTLETEESYATAQGRNFLPVIGIEEESATGTASGALAVYLYAEKNIEKDLFVFEQGNVLNKPSLIEVALSKTKHQLPKAFVGGSMRFIDKITKY